ncbi:hypothetical protein MH117_23000 [Paenibacillus sp. ACRRX]|uniref:hypothetical protein n=1 Tax=Paenibacillus sp. ACRRX TaxID=2918206 RepID=UPI001EF52911|nr:hypothetical protein [Paenibacillus sp. ACRRX]MCG7410286.1 hypothetical protein [Paenibacillus sp. ACRRX]
MSKVSEVSKVSKVSKVRSARSAGKVSKVRAACVSEFTDQLTWQASPVFEQMETIITINT